MKHALIILLATTIGANAQTLRDPATVPLPMSVELELKLGGASVIERFGARFDRLGSGAPIPVTGPGSSLRIRAAADRARVFLAYLQYDLDGDAEISRGEFNAHAEVAWGRALGDSEYAILDREWAGADGNGDNVLTLSEVHALAVDMHPVPELGPLGADGTAILGMDLDNDGFIGWDEVEAVLRSRMPG